MSDRLDEILRELPPERAAEARRILDARSGPAAVLAVIALIAAIGLAAALAIVSRLDPERP